MYLVGQTSPLTAGELQLLAASAGFSLPGDYQAFLATYGYGSVNELLQFTAPDADYIRSNFGDYLDLWDWPAGEQALALAGLTIATSIDGDIVALLAAAPEPYLLLPRHGAEPVHLASLAALLDYYEAAFAQAGGRYFDPGFQQQQQSIAIAPPAKMAQLHQKFLSSYAFDQVFNQGQQPKYMLPQLGGWVYFDLVYGSAIRVKYQTPFQPEATEIVRFLTGQLA